MENQSKMTAIDPNVLKKLQEVQIEILQEIVRICEKYELHYFLFYGTLIGAVRHKGFIPWDDDLDIVMPRNDYEKFMKIAPTELQSAFYLQNNDVEEDYWLAFAKVRKNDTLFEEPSLVNMPDTVHKGIFVDIFPFDYVHKNKGFILHLRFILAKAITETMHYKAGIYNSKESLNYYSLDMLLKKFSYRTLAKWHKRVSAVSMNEKAPYLADFNTSCHYLDGIYPVEYFYPEIQGEFNGHKFMIPKSYDTLLRKVYGNYMELPKEEDRVNHRTLRIIFDTKKSGDDK